LAPSSECIKAKFDGGGLVGCIAVREARCVDFFSLDFAPLATEHETLSSSSNRKDTSGGGGYLAYNDAGTNKKIALTKSQQHSGAPSISSAVAWPSA